MKQTETSVTDRGVIVIIISLTLGIFVLDLILPLGVAGGVPYVVVILLSLWLPYRRGVLFTAITVSVLTGLGLLLSAPGSEIWMVLVNRVLALFAIWITAVLILKHKRSEEEARQHMSDLAHVTRLVTMGEMAAGLAHELNQPLAAIANYASACGRILKAPNADTERVIEGMRRISEQAQRAGEIIRRIRSFATKQEPNRSTIRINQAVREVARLVDADAHDKHITMELDLAEPMPAISADLILIEQVVLNLVRNAFDALEDVNREHRRITIRTARAGSESVEVVVSDQGPGIAADAVETIFDPFTTTKTGGMGLGLSISKSIIEAHGGKLCVETGHKRGAAFRFHLPVMPGHESEDV